MNNNDPIVDEVRKAGEIVYPISRRRIVHPWTLLCIKFHPVYTVAGRPDAASLLIIWTLIGGCTVGPNYHQPQSGAPDSFDSSVDNASTVASTQPSPAGSRKPVELAVWWKSLNDPKLDALVNRAVVANYDIRTAVARLQEGARSNMPLAAACFKA